MQSVMAMVLSSVPTNPSTVKQAVLEGTNQTESLAGNGRDEWIYAYNGFDTIRAAGGDDRAYGGYGNDTIYGGNWQ